MLFIEAHKFASLHAWNESSCLTTPPHDPTVWPPVAEWYASWCAGCKKSYPDVCRVASDPLFRKAFKFVKVSIETPKMKEVSKADGVATLPSASVYGPEGEGLLATFGIPASKVKGLAKSLKTIMENPDKCFALDPNGFVIVHGPKRARVLSSDEGGEEEDKGGGGDCEEEEGCATVW